MKNINRRDLLKTTIGASLASITAGAFNAFAVPSNINSKGKISKIGVQLYTIRDLMAENVERSIGQVAELGYKEVEFAGYFGRSAAAIKTTLDQNGLTAPSTHVNITEVMGDKLKSLIEYSNIVGHKYIIIPFLQPEDRKTMDQYKRHAELFNMVGEECRKSGIQFTYHNHEFEFHPINGVLPYDYLLDQLSGDVLKMQMDLHWIIKAGKDPIEYFKKYPGRFPLCHVKDLTTDGKMVDVGHGVIDFASIFSHSELAGLNHYVVEHDEPDNSLQSIKNSFQTLNQMIIAY